MHKNHSHQGTLKHNQKCTDKLEIKVTEKFKKQIDPAPENHT